MNLSELSWIEWDHKAPRCNCYGDLPDGRHITELEDADLNHAELAIKRKAIAEDGGYWQ